MFLILALKVFAEFSSNPNQTAEQADQGLQNLLESYRHVRTIRKWTSRARLKNQHVSKTMHSWKMQSLQPTLLYIFTRATISPGHQCSQLPYTFCPRAWGSLCSWESPFDSCKGEVLAPCQHLCSPLTLKQLRITIFKTQIIMKVLKNQHFANR